MEYRIKAIQTRYKGILFRSRLEAKWAAFFDQLGWKWQYEPLDLDGWIPDFLIEDQVLVEVKPFLKNEEWQDEICIIQNAMLNQAGELYWTLLLGAHPHEKHIGNLIFSELNDLHAAVISDAGSKIDLHPVSYKYRTPMLGLLFNSSLKLKPDGKRIINSPVEPWAKSCNAIRWEKK